MAPVYAATAGLQISQLKKVDSQKHVPTKRRAIICPSWGCGTPPFRLVPVKLEITCQGTINADYDADCTD